MRLAKRSAREGAFALTRCVDSPIRSVSVMKRHVKEQSVLSCFPPSSPGSCLAHKESSKSPFLPTFLPLVLLLLLPKSPKPLSRPSFRVLPSRPHPFLRPSSLEPLSRCSPRMLMHARSATVLAGPPVLTRVLPDPLLYPVLPSFSRLSSSQASSFIWPNLIHQRDPI